MDKWYVGYADGRAQLFQADHPKYATPAASGYDSVIGPFNTKEEALENEPKAS